MKKIAYLFAASAVLMAMSSCEVNTNPKFKDVTDDTKFVLNTPALADQYYDLTADGEIDLTWSQPDWGFPAAATYSIEVSLDPSFTAEDEDGALYDWSYTLPTTYHACAVSVPMEEVAIAICTLRGITDEDQYVQEPAAPLYIRVHGEIPQVAHSGVTSNVIVLKNVNTYCAIQSPGKIYLVGNPEGWKGPDAGNAAHYADWALYEPADNIGCQIYTNTFDICAYPMFRFYTALTGWDADSWGSQVDDNPIDVELTNGEFIHDLVKGKGAFNFTNFTEAGPMWIQVDMNTHKVTIIAK